MTEAFAAVGMFVTLVMAAAFLVAAVSAVVSSVKGWLKAKDSLANSVLNLTETQRALMKANNNLNERVKALEEHVGLRGEGES